MKYKLILVKGVNRKCVFNYHFLLLYRVKDKFTIIHPSDVVLLEGILVFYHKDVMDMFDMKLFVDTDADTRLARRGMP